MCSASSDVLSVVYMSQLVPRGPASLDRLDYMDANMYSDWTRGDEKRMLLSLDGLPTGVQTPTTPTLTPTTLRVIATEIMSLEHGDESYHNEAGFVPPVIQPPGSTYLNMVDTKSWQGGSAIVTNLPPSTLRPSVVTSVPQTTVSPAPSALPVAVPSTSPSPAPTRRNVGGRRPNKAKGISAEEEERRQVRRERNKAAAARCRKRRMDHTNSLVMETEDLEQKKLGLQQEIQELNGQVEELQFLLDAHKATCRYQSSSGMRPDSPVDIKPLVKHESQPSLQPLPAKRPALSVPTSLPLAYPNSAVAVAAAAPKPPRPTSLPVASQILLKSNSSVSEMAGIAISTPSTGLAFNFDSLMEGGTGLTPVSGPIVPSCSSQQRSQNVDLASPDASIGNKLVSL